MAATAGATTTAAADTRPIADLAAADRQRDPAAAVPIWRLRVMLVGRVPAQAMQQLRIAAVDLAAAADMPVAAVDMPTAADGANP